jgi:hypothetical protein
MSSVYTVELVAALHALEAPVTFAAAEAFAAKHGLKPRSVVAKIKSEKIAYVPKPTKVTKVGEPVVAKATIVAAIGAALGVAVPSLEKATKEDLVRLISALTVDNKGEVKA